MVPTTTAPTHRIPTGRASTLELFKLFRAEQTDPRALYEELGERAARELDERVGPLAAQRLADVGCGPGWYTRALRRRGAEVIPLDYSQEELELAGEPPEGAIVGDAMNLPFADGSLDGVFASNMLEHVPDPLRVLTEFERVVRPGGWAYVSWTNWYSPWGGHELSPYQYLGPRLGPRLYLRRHGPAPKHVVGESLFPLHIGPTLRWLRDRPGLEVVRVEPRYWPWARPIVDVPGLREVLTWNCAVWLRRRA